MSDSCHCNEIASLEPNGSMLAMTAGSSLRGDPEGGDRSNLVESDAMTREA